MLKNNIQLEDWLSQNLELLQNYHLTRDLRGHSRVPCYVLNLKDDEHQNPASTQLPQKLFMKLYPTNRVQDLQCIQSLYQQAQIPTAQILQLGYLEETNQTYCAYEFIEGKTLRELLKQKSVTNLEDIGYRTGAELGKMQHISHRETTLYDELHQEIQQLFKNAHQQKYNYNHRHEIKLPTVNLHKLQHSLEKLELIVRQIPPTFVHGDINLYNIILNQDQPVFIDTDGSKISTRALDFRGNCWWGWTGNNTERERAVYRGIYRGYFSDHIPNSFHAELCFAIIYEFLLRLKRYQDIDEQTYYSFLRWHDIFQLTNYFQNYRFDWFETY